MPSVLLVIEGGPNTIETVYKSVQQSPPMAVVVIKESGRASDCLAYVIEHVTDKDVQEIDALSDDELENNVHFKFVKETLCLFRPDQVEDLRKAFRNLMLCLKNRNLVG